MKKFRVTPMSGTCKAPYIVVEVDGKEKNPYQKAIEFAENKSRLSDFGWSFYAELI